MRKFLFLVLVSAMASVGHAALSVTVDSVAFNDRNRQFTVLYTLSGGKAIVTLDILANDVSLGGKLMASVMGEINQKLTAGQHKFQWTVDADWSGSTADLKFKLRAFPVKEPPLFLTVELYGGHLMRYYEREDLLPHPVNSQHYKESAIIFKKVAAKGVTYVMGDSAGQTADRRLTPHKVTFTNDYYFGVFPLTVGQYRNAAHWSSDTGNYSIWAALSTKAEYYDYVFNRDDHSRTRAVGGLSLGYYLRGAGANGYWPKDGHRKIGSDHFFRQLRNFMPGYEVDAPTSAQWEYVCRAGTGTKYHNGSDTDASDIAWYAGNNAEDPFWVEGWPHGVGLKKPNAWGFYDMQGNVLEACLDWLTATNNPLPDETDPPGRDLGEGGPGQRLCKGSSFLEDSVRSSGGYWISPWASWGVQNIDVGVRICFNAEGVEE